MDLRPLKVQDSGLSGYGSGFRANDRARHALVQPDGLVAVDRVRCLGLRV